jgi:uncharacterized protein (TIGR02265 family)
MPGPIEVRAALFEGLFFRGLHLPEAVTAELRALGYDADSPAEHLTLALWLQCAEVARRVLLPESTREEAYRELGRRFLEGYLRTVVGRLLAATFRFRSPRTFVQRLPRYIATGIPGLQVSTEWASDAEALVHLALGEPEAAHFLAGIIEVALGRICTPGLEVTVVPGETETRVRIHVMAH